MSKQGQVVLGCPLALETTVEERLLGNRVKKDGGIGARPAVQAKTEKYILRWGGAKGLNLGQSE